WEPIGRPHGDVACFSFHPRKVLTTGDGGMLCTNEPRHDQRFRLWRQHGMSVSDALRHRAATVIVEHYATTGYNYRLTDLQAAVGIEQLKRLPAMLDRRRELADAYAQALADCPALELPREPSYASSNWQSYAVRLRDPRRQPLVMQALLDRGISTRRGVMCAHLEAPYATAWPAGSLPASVQARDRGLMLPLFPDMSAGDVQRVADSLRDVLDRSHHATAA
ncbi:MAG TPA: DegT/DnrJ/EryC1/StrS family aminotransferase, partial [Pirellulales bacterium]